MTEHERSLERIADRALARRKIVRNRLPIVAPRVFNAERGHWGRIVAVLDRWMTTKEVARKSGLTARQVRGQFKWRRDKVELRSSRGNGFEWRVK